jgi:hypothetical protein
MPNYCHNLLRIDGEDEVLDQLAVAVADSASDDPCERFSYARIVPVAEGEDEGAAWGSCSLYCLEVVRRSRELNYEFQSSWDPPMAVIETLATQWPTLTFELVWVEPLTARWGTRFYREGARQHWNEGGSSGSNDDDWEMRSFLEGEWPSLAEKWWEDDFEDEYPEDEDDPQENPYYVDQDDELEEAA